MAYRDRPDARAIAEARLREALGRTLEVEAAMATAKRDVALAEARVVRARSLVGASAELIRQLKALSRAGAPATDELERAAGQRAEHERELDAAEAELGGAHAALKSALGAQTVAKQMEAAARAELAGL